MTSNILRKEIHGIIDAMPDKSLPALKPLLAFIVEDYWKPVIESASPEEISMANERIKDYEKDPSSFISLDSIK